jgi:hypothetical protein
MTQTTRPSFHVPAEAGPHIAAISGRTCLGDAPSIIRTSVISFHDMVELETSGYQLVVRNAAGEEQFFSPFARTAPMTGDTRSASPESPCKIPRAYFPTADVAAKILSIESICIFGSYAKAICAAVATFDRASEKAIQGWQFRVRGEGGFERPYSPFAQLQRADFPQLSNSDLAAAEAVRPGERSGRKAAPIPAV